VEALASQIWYIEQGRMSLFKGGYRAYMEDKRKAEAPPNVTPSKATQSNGAAKTQAPNQRKGGLSPYQLEKKLKSLEAQVHQLEAELAQINEALSEAAANGQFNTVSDLGYKHIATEAALNAALEEWASLAD
jgi:ATPase subunit of ABC transporter with duplicated ATPase domains